MNIAIRVLHPPCTIGKKEGYPLGLHGKRRSGFGWRIDMERYCFYLARMLNEQTRLLYGCRRIVQHHSKHIQKQHEMARKLARCSLK